MSEVAEIIAELVRAGTDAELVGRVAAALAGVTERNSVSRNVTHHVTPDAIRMRRYRERKSNKINVLDAEKAASVATIEGVTGRNEGVTSDNIIISSEIEVKEEKNIVRSVTRKRNSYAQDFEAFWTAFPTDAGMSKLEASKAWDRLSPEDRQAAFQCIPPFKAWVAQQGPNYRIVHACRYLSQRRFEGFSAHAAKVQEVVGSRVYVQSGTDAMDAWDAYYKRTRGKLAPRDQRGGWYFETEYPEALRRRA